MATISDTTPKPVNPPSIVFKEPLYKPSTSSSSNSNALSSSPPDSPKPRRNSQSHLEFSQHWTTVTSNEDSWAMRERRRASMWAKVDGYPGGSHMTRARTISGGSRGTSGSAGLGNEGKAERREKKGSILSMFHDDDDHEEVPKQRRQSITEPRERRGSILSLFKRGKDTRGRSVLSSDASPVVEVK